MTELNTVRSFKSNIKTLELSLNKYMDMDLSNNEVRGEMRVINNEISSQQDQLSSFLNNLN